MSPYKFDDLQNMILQAFTSFQRIRLDLDEDAYDIVLAYFHHAAGLQALLSFDLEDVSPSF